MRAPYIIMPGPVILRGTVGSTVHGLSLPGTDDTDEIGVCLESQKHVIGLAHYEQTIYRSAAEREHRHDAPSRPGDLDLTIYSLRKWCRLALNGNPTILLLLFIPDEHLKVVEPAGQALRDAAGKFASRRAGKAFLGYMIAQRQRLNGERGQRRVRRPELEAAHGYDTKYAMHILRLGYQGREYLNTGRMTLPMPEPERARLMAVRRGQVPLNEVLTEAGDLEAQLKALLDTSPLPKDPDTYGVDLFLIDAYQRAWGNKK